MKYRLKCNVFCCGLHHKTGDIVDETLLAPWVLEGYVTPVPPQVSDPPPETPLTITEGDYHDAGEQLSQLELQDDQQSDGVALDPAPLQASDFSGEGAEDQQEPE